MKSREALNLAESPTPNTPPVIKRERKHTSDYNTERDREVDPPPTKRAMPAAASSTGELSHSHNLHHQQSQKQVPQVLNDQKHQTHHTLQEENDTHSDISLTDHHNTSIDEIAPPRRMSTPHRNGSSPLSNTCIPTATILSGMQFKITSRGK